MSVVRGAIVKAALRSLAVCMGLCLMGLAIASPVAFAEVSPALGGTGGSPLESPLLVPKGMLLLGEQSVREAEAARRASPEDTIARQESQTKYEGLSTEEAAKLAAEAFPEMVDEPAGGAPKLPVGESILSFPSVDAEQVDLGGGARGVIESIAPLAVETSSGRRVPVDLSLRDIGGVFEPKTPVSGVRIPKQLSSGMMLSDSGLSLTPVNVQGVPLGGSEGVVDGASVFYGNTQTDADTVVKPTILGFDASTVLRSANSPQQLFFRVGLPAGASLVQVGGALGVVRVLDEGSVIATVQPPVAVDATGKTVPVSMAVSGDTLALTVGLAAEEYEYPVYVDPTVTDKEMLLNPGNWAFYTDNKKVFEGARVEGHLEISNKNNTSEVYYPEQLGYFLYVTQGASRIYAFEAGTSEQNDAGIPHSLVDEFELRRADNEIEPGNGPEGTARKTEEPRKSRTEHSLTVCVETACGPVGVVGSEQNDAYFGVQARAEAWGAFNVTLQSAAVEIQQEQAPTAGFDTSDSTIEGLPNALLSGKWYKATANATFGLDAYDQGIGVYKQALSSPNKSGWGYALKNEARNECQGVQCNQCYESPCTGKASGSGKPLTFSLMSAAGGELPEGEDTVEGKAEDAAGLSATATAKIKIDNLPPHNITFSGLPSTHEISDGQHFLLKASAIDGVEGTSSSGVASIVLTMDGQEVGTPSKGCSPGPCTTNGEWTLSGENYATGQYVLDVVATDNAGNVVTEEFHVTIHHAAEVAVGPGSVNPVTGELSLSATDVSLDTPDGGLTVKRSYRSRHLTQGTEGPLGPQWNLSLGAQQSLSRVSGGVILTSGSGEQIVFESKGKGEFTSPTGDAGLVLTEISGEKGTLFTLGENGSVTTFEVPSGGSGVWMPSSVEGPNGTNATLYKFKVEGGVMEPKEELAPVPAGVSCGKEISELKEGCRALKFEYATETKAKGEKASEWGEFARHLSKIKYIAWNASKTKIESVVAEYAYDAKGKLRAEWNPEITPLPLKTAYGYDAEGHVTAASTAGHEPELLEQGTVPSDTSPGRLLAVAVPSAATALGAGEAPVNTEVPMLSSTKPAVGTKISVNLTGEKTPGKWSANPLAFIYQWEDCGSSGKECTPIPGAVNQAYYPVAGDEGHTLVAEAIALNATGAVTASSAATSTVASGVPNTPLPEPPVVGSDAVTTLEYQVPVSGSGAPYEMSSTEAAKWGQTDDPSEAMAVFPADKVMGWPAKEYKRETVYYLDGKDRAVNTALPTGGISVTEFNLYNDVIRTLSPDNRLKAVSGGCKPGEECKYATESTYEEKGTEPGIELLSTIGPQHTVKLAVGKEGKVDEEALAREHTRYFYNEGAPTKGGPYHLVTKTIEGAETPGKEEFDTRTTESSYGGQGGLGWELRKPTSVIIDPGGLNLVHTMEYNSSTGNVIETKTPAASGKDAKVPPTYASQFGAYGTENGKFKEPRATAIAGTGNVYVLDTGNSRLEEFSPSGGYLNTFGKEGSGDGEFKSPYAMAEDSKNDLWVADTGNNRVQELNSKTEYHAQFGKEGTGAGQFKEPKGIAVTAGGYVFVVDSGNNRIEKLKENGEFVLAFGYGVSNGKAEFEICTTSCQAGLTGSGNGEFNGARGIAVSSSGDVLVADAFNNRVEEFTEKGEYVTKFGSAGKGNLEFEEPKAITTDSVGDLFVTDTGNDRIQELSSSGAYMTTFGVKGTSSGQFEEPWGATLTSTGSIYVADVKNNRVQKWVPTITGNEGAHDTKTIYYTAKGEAEVTECREHPEWANLPCETMPAAQPGASGPELPTTKYTYNIWYEPETTKETVGSTTRTKTNTYDAAGRPKTAAISSTVGEPLPTVTDEYNKETGALEKQCANEGKPCTEGKPKTITSIANKLGQLESYTDAAESENKTTYEWDIDERIKKVNTEKGSETYIYSETTGLPAELLNEYGTSKLTFTAGFDVEGNMTMEGYPNGMTAAYTFNTVDKPTGLEYEKKTHCTEKCIWFKDSIIPSIHGQWIEQTSTLSHQAYGYDKAGRLTEVQNTPTGKGCTVRLYALDEDSNRTSLMTREPGTEGKCATEGGEGQGYTYDSADHLIEPGITYNPFGDITALPAQNSEDPELASTYYADNQVQSQTQNKQTISYILDPAGRTLEADATGEPTKANILSHYTGPSNTPAWTINTSTKAWKRNIMGINGGLAAIQNEGTNSVLQLTNLHGDIIATASISETATELASKADTSEFGVPTTSNPEKYAWLGAMGLPTELPSGVIAMGARSYVPQLGRFLQPDPVSGGSANAYGYTFGDPVNSFDLTGAYTNTASAATLMEMALEGEGMAARGKAERERAAAEGERMAERYAAEVAAHAAAEAAAEAAAAAGPQYASEEGYWEEWEEWYGEEGEYEYAAYNRGANPESQEGYIEEGHLLQPLQHEVDGSEAGIGTPLAIPACRGGEQGEQTQAHPCARDAFLGIHIHLAHILHTVSHWIIPTTDEIRERHPLDPPWVDEAAHDIDDWGFDSIEFDW